MTKAIDAEIDQLFQVPPDQFTAARNALAKGAGAHAAGIKALTRPPIPAWAVNQLYWRDRETYDALVDAANEMRKTHRAVIEGRKGDLRAAGREHDAALDAALESALALLEDAGQPATDATRHAVLNTLRALPSSDPPGRLTQTLAPGGFEMLAGVTPAAPARRPTQKSAPAKAGAAPVRKAAAERAIREADQRARQAEFEAARAARDASKAERRLEEARKELEAAQKAFADAEKDAGKVTRARETADRRLRDAQSALDALKRRT